MYETFYHLSATPFRLTPDPRFCFNHSGYEQARAYLQYAFDLGEGFIIVTGRAGAGKTTLVESFLKELETGNVVAAKVAAANIKATDLLRSVAYVYGIEAENLDKATLLRRIAQHLSTLMHRRQRVLLVIDEAQSLSHSALEELRLLADLAEGARPLLQIFLVGQEKLRSVMRERDMEQLQQRVIGACRLEPMGLAETKDYIHHRLCRAGWSGDPELTGAAVLAIFQYSGGTPRHINKICTRLMLQGFMENKHTLDRDDVVGIANELDEEQLAPAARGNNALDDMAADPALAAALRHDRAALSELAVRAPKPARERRELTVVSTVEKGSTASVQREHWPPEGRDTAVGQIRDWRQFGEPHRAQSAHPVWNRARRGGSRLLAPVVRELLKLQETPAALFAVVAAVTVSVAAITSYMEQRDVRQQSLFVVNSQPLQPGLSTQGHASSESVDPRDGRPLLRQEDVAIAVPAQVRGQARDGVVAHEQPGGDAGSEVSRQPGPVSAAAVEAPVVAVADAAADAPGVAKQPVGKDAGAGEGGVTPLADALSESAPVAPSDSSRPGRGPPATQSPVVPDSVNPDTDNPVDDVPGQLALAESPVVADPAQPLSARQEPVPAAVSLGKKTGDLLALAETALGEDRLMIPEQNNAYSYYQQVLALEPGNADALSGLDKIVGRYIQLARYAVQRQDKVRAKRYVERGLRVRPRDERLLALQDIVDMVSVTVRPEYRRPTSVSVYQPPALSPERQSRTILQRLKGFFSGKSSVPREE